MPSYGLLYTYPALTVNAKRGLRLNSEVISRERTDRGSKFMPIRFSHCAIVSVDRADNMKSKYIFFMDLMYGGLSYSSSIWLCDSFKIELVGLKSVGNLIKKEQICRKGMLSLVLKVVRSVYASVKSSVFYYQQTCKYGFPVCQYR